jgi:hypothetical protein
MLTTGLSNIYHLAVAAFHEPARQKDNFGCFEALQAKIDVTFRLVHINFQTVVNQVVSLSGCSKDMHGSPFIENSSLGVKFRGILWEILLMTSCNVSSPKGPFVC